MKYRRVVAGAGAVALGIALAVAGVLPAQALGSRSAVCDNDADRTFLGVSNTARAYTQETAGWLVAGDCGSSQVRASYKTYSGSPVYWTSWKTGSNFAEAKPGNIMVGGEHKVTAPTWGSVYFFRT